jgi:hypothetical protein
LSDLLALQKFGLDLFISGSAVADAGDRFVRLAEKPRRCEVDFGRKV